MAGFQMQGAAPMQGMAMTPAALAQMAAAQGGQLPKANSAQLQQQLVAGGVAPGSMAMPAVSGAPAVAGMQAALAWPCWDADSILYACSTLLGDGAPSKAWPGH